MPNQAQPEQMTITVEAETAEDALAEVTRRLGPRATIESAERVSQSGLMGLLGREVVRIVASGIPADPGPERDPGGEGGFRALLARNLGTTRPPGPGLDHAVDLLERTAPAPDDTDHLLPEAPGGRSTPTRRRVRWDSRHLARLGIPPTVLAFTEGIDGDDDASWIAGLAEAVKPWCGELPSSEGFLVGPRAGRLAEALRIPTIRPGETVPEGGTVAVEGVDAPASRLRGRRHLHLVTDADPGWRSLLEQDPAVVSWTSEKGLPGALEVCALTGAQLGWGMSSAFGSPAVEATPVDVALMLRSLMDRT